MDFHGGGELETVGVCADSFQDFEFSTLLVVKLNGGPCGLNMFLKKSDLATNFKSWFREIRGIGVVGLSDLNVGHLGNEGLVESFERLD